MDNVANQPALPLPQADNIAAIRMAEEIIASCPQVELSTKHLVHAGMYARTLHIPAGVDLVGALVNVPTISICSGDITVTTADGPQRLTGFHVLASPAGFKRVGRTHAPTDWTMLFTTDLIALGEIEDYMTAESDRLQSRKLLDMH